MTKKLTYIIPSLGVGGAEVALLSAIPALSKAFDFKLICLKKYDASFVSDLSENERQNIITFHGFLLNYVKAFLFILRFNPDILVTSLWKAAILGIAVKLFRRSVKYVEFIHSSTYFHFLDKLFTKLSIQSSDAVFCDSLSAKEFAEKQFLKKPIYIISFLRLPPPATWSPKAKIALRAAYVGRFHEQKRVDSLIFLVKTFVDNGLPFEVDLFGRDDGSMSLAKNLISSYHLERYVFIKGEVPANEIGKLLPQYDFYFQTSAVEGMAMSVVEAMQHGLICVLTNVGEIQRYAKNKENAIIIEAMSDLSEAVEQVKKVAADIRYANYISKNAYLQFATKESFANSIVATLQQVLL
jgi:glycosyltransferase involved in cell wall biosynthesis